MAFQPESGNVSETLFDTRLTVKFTDSSGKTQSTTYQNVKNSATALQKYNFAKAIAYLTSESFASVQSGDSFELAVEST